MICPECSSKMAVAKTMVLPGRTLRLQECPCGCRYETSEEVIRRLPVAPATPPLHPQRSRNGPGSAGSPPAAAAVAGGVGGGLPSGQGSGSDPDPLSVDPPNRARVKRRRSSSAPAEYTPAFEQLWRSTAMTGGKRKAFVAWWRLDRPDPHVVADAWARWMRLEQWQRGIGVPHVSSWLNGRCHEQEPHEVTRRTAEADARERARERARRDSAAAVAATDRKIIELRQAARRTAAPPPRDALAPAEAPPHQNGVGTHRGASQSVSDVVRELAEAKAVR